MSAVALQPVSYSTDIPNELPVLVAHLSGGSDTFSKLQPYAPDEVQSWLQDQMLRFQFAYVTIRTDSGLEPSQGHLQTHSNSEPIQTLQCQKITLDVESDSFSQSGYKGISTSLDAFARGVRGNIYPDANTINMANRVIQAALNADLNSSEIVHDDDDGMLLLEFTLLKNGLVIEAELGVNGVLNASAYNENDEDEHVRYLLNTTEQEFVALFL